MLLIGALPLALASCGPRGAPTGDALTISVPYELRLLDPHARDWISSFAVASNLYEPLTTTDANMAVRPCLAQRWENRDPLTWIFHLQPDVTFHSGRRLTAEDVVFTFERLLKSRELEVAGFLTSVASVRALGSLTVEVKTKRPTSFLLANVRFVLIVPKGSTTESLNAGVDGTGPYTFVSWTPGEEIRMARNERYWGVRPAVPSVTFRLARTPEQAFSDFVSGKSRFIQCNSRKLERALGSRSDLRILRRTSLFTKFVGFDLARDTTPFVPGRSNPFRDRRVRHALDLAIDRAALTARLSTSAVPASQLVPPFIFGFDPSLPKPLPDATRARALLSQAGYPDGFDVTLHTRTLFAEPAVLLKEMLAKVAVRVDVKILPDSEFFELTRSHGVSFQLSRFGCPTGDVHTLLVNAVHTIDRERHFGETNDGRYSDGELDRAIEESVEIREPEQRRRALQQVMSRLMDELIYIPLYIDEDVYAVGKELAWQPRNDSFVLAAEVGTGVRR